MNSPAYPPHQPATRAKPPQVAATPITAAAGPSIGNAVLLPGSALGGYAGLRVAAQRIPALGQKLQQARSQSWRDLLSTAQKPTAAARQAASRGSTAATRALASSAAKTAPKVAARAGMMAAGRLAVAPIPVVGEVVAAATWLFDKDSRGLVNGFISKLNGVGFPPHGDAEPAPPRTHFLPLTADGNRDQQIEKIDQGMTRTNNEALNYEPRNVWPSQPAISMTPDFAKTAAAINKLGPKASGIADSIRAASNSLAGMSAGNFTESIPAKLGPLAEALDQYQSSVAPAAAAAVNGVTTKANDFYQQFRQINAANRAEIANSASGLIPLRANHVNAAVMDDAVAASKAATAEIGKHNAAMTNAYSNWTVPTTAPGQATTVSAVKPSAPTPSTPPAVPAEPATPPPAENTPQGKGKSPLDSALSSIPPIPSIPSMPGGGFPGGGMPAMPQMPYTPPAPGLDPMAKETPLDEHPKDEKKKEEGPEGKGEKNDPIGLVKNPAEPPNNPPGAPAPEPPAAPAGADKIVRIGDKDYPFDSPRIAAAIRESYAAAQSGPGIPITQALANAGFTIPPAGQDLGKAIDDINVAKPGSIIVSDGNQSAYYLGAGEAMDEEGNRRPVGEVMNFTGPNQGIFEMPEPGTPIIDPTAVAAGTGATSTSPATVTAADVAPATPAGSPSGQPLPQPH